MPTLTLAIPRELKEEMDSVPELNWSEIARGAISKKLAEYKIFKSIVARSKLTKKDALQMAKEVNAGMYKKLKKLHPELL
ncbi:MAG: hypothetical protein AABX25_01135 [Nanoarchaeota archaeon]